MTKGVVVVVIRAEQLSKNVVYIKFILKLLLVKRGAVRYHDLLYVPQVPTFTYSKNIQLCKELPDHQFLSVQSNLLYEPRISSRKNALPHNSRHKR